MKRSKRPRKGGRKARHNSLMHTRVSCMQTEWEDQVEWGSGDDDASVDEEAPQKRARRRKRSSDVRDDKLVAWRKDVPVEDLNKKAGVYGVGATFMIQIDVYM